MCEEQRAFVPAKRGPVCRRHGPMMHYSSCVVLLRGTYRAVTVLRCDHCAAKAVVPRPVCNVCGDSMHIARDMRSSVPKFYWRCKKEQLSQSFELCECGSTGWLHMDNRHEGGADPHSESILGIPHGMHIDSCSDCGHLRFKGSIDAELAHRLECGCGHGLPKDDDSYTWIGYRGANNEVWKAMHGAGFHVLDDVDGPGEDFEVYIEAGKAQLFITTLDQVYASMEEARLRESTEAAQKLLNKFDTTFPEVRNYMSEAKKMSEGLTCPHPDHDPDRNGFRKAAKTPSFDPFVQTGRTSSRGYSKNEVSTRGMGSMTPCRFTESEMQLSGFDVQKTKEGAICTDANGFPYGTLRKIAAQEVLEFDFARYNREQAVMPELFKSIMLLIGQLNEMNFQDHPKEEMLRLKSRQRGLLEQLDALKKSESPVYLHYLNSTSMGHDRQANYARRHLPTAGGFRIEELHPLEGEDNFHGIIYLDGITFYSVFIKVQNVNGEQQPTNDPEGRYKDLMQFNDCNMQTVKIDGRPGDFVMCIYPATE